MYRTGGLEPSDDSKNETLNVSGINYVITDKLKTMLRDSFIDWGTFLEIYHDNLDYTLIFDQMIKLLGVNESENLRELMIPLAEKIYNLPADAHMACMLKQFVVFEPVSIAMHALFTTIKLHYEQIVHRFLHVRNKYILSNNLKDKTNDVDHLKKYWEEMNDQYDLDSSSTTLLFLNPPNGLKSKININVTGLESVISKLRDAIKKFHYAGFCPKAPHIRLKALLEFPINEFVSATKKMDKDIIVLNYTKIEKHIAEKMKELPKKPVIKDSIKRQSPPAEMTDKIELAKWYMDAILDLRKELLPQGAQFEEYYTKQARIFVDLNDYLKSQLHI
jgi:hypothetical protein